MKFKSIHILITSLLLSSCIMSYKINYEVSRVSNSKKEVILFSKSPSYAEKYSFHVSLIREGRNLRNDEQGNIFIGEYNEEDKTKEILNSFEFKWLSSDTLEIFYSDDIEIKKKVDQLKGIILIYERKHLPTKNKAH